MINRSCKIVMVPFLLFVMMTASFGRDYIIYSISQDLPMGEPGEVIRKNYYLNLGQIQGVKAGDTLEVFRALSRLDPYNSNKRYNYKVKIGEISVIHSEGESAIGKMASLRNDENTPYFEVDEFMIGDKVSIKLDN